jgi:hypothetical protein
MNRFMRTRPIVVVVALALALGVADERALGAGTGWLCRATPVEPCFRHRGRLSSQNGIPLAIWLVGTTRRVSVDNTEIPSAVERYLSMTSEDHSYIFGDFDICPLEADNPGHMRGVCVSGAANLVVQNLAGTRPPFRLLSTWPPSASAAANALDPRIGAANPQQVEEAQATDSWDNPSLVIGVADIDLIARGLPSGRTTVAIADLRRALVGLPIEAWPLGRVVTVGDNGLRSVDANGRLIPRETESIRRNHDTAVQILRALGISVVLVPSA